MLKSISRRYLVFGIMILLLFIPLLGDEYTALYFINFIVLLAYYSTINFATYKQDNYYTKSRLSSIVFFYSVFFVTINKILSFYYTDNFFLFSDEDAKLYHEGAIEMASESFFGGIGLILSRFEFDDLGIFIVIGSLYRIIESNLIVNFFYIFVGIATAHGIFSISKNFMSVKYSFLCALTYSVSSFVIFFHSSGLKESFLLMIIVLSFDNFFLFLRTKKIKNLILLVCFLLSILLFRPVISFFCLASIGIGILLTLKGKAYSYLLVVSGVVLIFFLYSYISVMSESYLGGGDAANMVALKESSGMVKGSVQFTYAVNILASSLGPLPTVLPAKPILSMYSVGLIYRVLLSVAFWLGVYYVIKYKVALIYPLLLFVFLEAISLTFILEALELRKSLPHFPFIYIIAFWFLDNYDRKIIEKKRERRMLKNIWSTFSVLSLIIIIYWNYR